MTAVVAALDAAGATRHRGGAAQAGRDDAGEHGRRGERAALRDVLPAHGHRGGRDDRAGRPGVRQGAAGRPGGRRGPRQGRGRRQDDVRRAGPRGGGAGRRARRRRRAAGGAPRGGPGRRGRPRRDDPDARPQGPRELPRRAQRRAPGPGRDVGGAARWRPPLPRWPGVEGRHDGNPAAHRCRSGSSWSPTAARSRGRRSRWRGRCCTGGRCGSRSPPGSTTPRSAPTPPGSWRPCSGPTAGRASWS